MTRRIGLRRPSHLRLAAFAFLATTGLCALDARPAAAQGWLKDRRYAEGAGIKTGDFELHPGIGGEVGYDSNWFLRSNDEGPGVVNAAPATPRRDAAIFRVTPSFSFSTLGPQRTEGAEAQSNRMIVFRGSLSATLWGFVGQEMSEQHNVSGDANLRLDIAPQRPVGFGVWAGYRRMIRPNAASADAALGFNQSQLNGGAEAIFQPGSGTFDMRGGYQIYANLFEQTNGVPFSSLAHELSVRNRWRFRPRTALFSDTTLRLTTFPESDRAFSYLANQTPVRSRFGINGLLTPRIGALASAGYGATFLQNAGAPQTKQFDSFLAQAELTYYFGVPDVAGGNGGEPGQVSVLLSSWSLGYNRDFQQSLFTNFYHSDRIYTHAVVAGAGRMIVTLDGGFEFLRYPDVFANAGGGAPSAAPTTPEFTNHRISGTLFAEYRLSDSFGLNATFDYQQMLSDTRLPLGGGQFFGLSWQRFQALAGARWFL